MILIKLKKERIMDIDGRALQVTTDWLSVDYVNETQRRTRLQSLIISALKEQDRLTRYLCVDRVAHMDYGPDDDVVIGNAIRKIMRAVAV